MKIEHLSVLATVVVAFAASTALILNGQSELRRDMWAGQSELRKDMRAGQAELRKDMRAGQAELRKDLRAGQAELRKDLRAVEAELRSGQTELRKEMQATQAELRQEMKAGQAELRAGQAEIRKDLESLEVRLAVVEQRPPGSPAKDDASAAVPAPTALLDGSPSTSDGLRPPRTPLLQAGTVTSQIGPSTAGGPNH